MANDLSNDFDFGPSDLDYGYDPLADAMTEEEEEDEKAGEFTGVPFLSLSAPETLPGPASKPEPIDEAPAAEQIAKLFERFNPRRRVLAGIMRFCDAPRSSVEVDEKVVELQKHDFSVYTGANYAALLEEAGALEKTDENGVPFRESPDREPQVVEVDGVAFLKPGPWREAFWLATDAARDHLAADDPLARFRDLLAKDSAYLDIYLRILDAADAEGGATTPQLNELIDDDPLVQNPRYYTAHFTDLLERCEAIRWEGTWVITDIGRMLLNGQIEAPVAADTKE